MDMDISPANCKSVTPSSSINGWDDLSTSSLCSELDVGGLSDNSADFEDTTDPFSSVLYEGADITIFESYFLLFQFAVRHSLTGKAFSELLQLIGVHIPRSSKAAKSVYNLKKYFIKMFPHARSTAHHYCSVCLSVLPNNERCSSCLESDVEEFVSIPLGPQLQEKMKSNNPHHYNVLRIHYSSLVPRLCPFLQVYCIAHIYSN